MLFSWMPGINIPRRAFLLDKGLLLGGGGGGGVVCGGSSGKRFKIHPLPLNSHVTLAKCSLSPSFLTWQFGKLTFASLVCYEDYLSYRRLLL